MSTLLYSTLLYFTICVCVVAAYHYLYYMHYAYRTFYFILRLCIYCIFDVHCAYRVRRGRLEVVPRYVGIL